MDPQINYGSVTINYTYDNQPFKDTGSFTINDPNNFIAVINDTNFPSNCLTPGISIEVILDKNSNNISSVSLNFNNRYLYQTIPSSVPISNVTINGNVILNKTPIFFKYNMIFQTIVQAYILYSFTPETVSVSVPVPVPVSVPVTDCFSQAALNQAATTQTQTSALLKMIDSENVFLSSDQKTQIASEAGKIVRHGVSIGEGVNNIGKAFVKE